MPRERRSNPVGPQEIERQAPPRKQASPEQAVQGFLVPEHAERTLLGRYNSPGGTAVAQKAVHCLQEVKFLGREV
jgi:hypothetical protein